MVSTEFSPRSIHVAGEQLQNPTAVNLAPVVITKIGLITAPPVVPDICHVTLDHRAKMYGSTLLEDLSLRSEQPLLRDRECSSGTADVRCPHTLNAVSRIFGYDFTYPNIDHCLVCPSKQQAHRIIGNTKRINL